MTTTSPGGSHVIASIAPRLVVTAGLPLLCVWVAYTRGALADAGSAIWAFGLVGMRWCACPR